jgi:tryptophan synthase alpha chain
MPIAVGFGISTPLQAQKVSDLADGVIIGSALIAHIKKNLGRPNLLQEAGDFLDRFRRALP